MLGAVVMQKSNHTNFIVGKYMAFPGSEKAVLRVNRAMATATIRPDALLVEESFARLLPPSVAVCCVAVDHYFQPHTDDELAIAGVVPKRRREFIAGRTAARSCLRALGIVAEAIPVGPGRQPIWPVDSVGSISHSGELAVAAVGRKPRLTGVGIDLECVNAVSEDIWAHIFLPNEIDFLRRYRGKIQALWATTIFSVKEAFFKMQYPHTGEWIDFLSVSVEKLSSGLVKLSALYPIMINGREAREFCACVTVCNEFVLTTCFIET
jgi:4'-phosphopantetheinyl transferase EntD